jgi:hypothetical protein
MNNFLKIINEIHESIKGGSRATLETEVISENFLLEKGIIQKKAEKVTFLDTKQIGENYLMLWNEKLILSLEHLEHLVLSNLELRELDLSSLKNLKKIELKSCKRDSIIYIAENNNLEELDISNLDLTIEGGPISLYAHPAQVGKVFPKDIENKCRDKDDYLVVTLHLAPPKHKSVESNDFPLKYLLRYKEAELGTILKKYWEQQPEYYTKYSSLEEARDQEKEDFAVLLEVEKRVNDNFYVSKNVNFDPNKDIVYPNLEEREFHDSRVIPECMTQKV